MNDLDYRPADAEGEPVSLLYELRDWALSFLFVFGSMGIVVVVTEAVSYATGFLR